MEGDSPAAVMAALGQTDDLIDRMLPDYAAAAGFLAKHERLLRMLYLATKQQMTQDGLLKDARTETKIKDLVEKFMIDSNPELFKQAAEMAEAEAFGKAMFKGLDARRSIGQSLLGIHKESEAAKRFGQGARGQAGQ